MKTKLFFIGIGGKGLNGIAKICLEKGYDVYGVDMQEKPETLHLINNGAKIFYKHNEKNLPSNIDILIYSSIAKNTPEFKRAERLGIKTMKRSEFLSLITKNNFRISVAGSHGKSTTTALLGLSTINSGIDSTIYGGAYTKEFDGYNHLGKSKYAIMEACEYDESFYDLVGDFTVITSIEKSHMEYYLTEDKMITAFKNFISKHNKKSTIFINGDFHLNRKLAKYSPGKIITFGFTPRNDYFISDVKKGQYSSKFSVFYLGKKIIGDLEINIPGDYNILNFTSVIAVMHELQIPLDGIYETARNFTGVGRRFEITQNKNGNILIDDFAHHPTQVKYLFDGIKQFYPKQKICAVFQPRQFNLMKNFINEYGESFRKADEVIITEILPALGDTKEDINSISTKELANKIIEKSKKPVKIIETFPEIVNYVKSNYKTDGVITTIGAGDIYKVRDKLMQ